MKPLMVPCSCLATAPGCKCLTVPVQSAAASPLSSSTLPAGAGQMTWLLDLQEFSYRNAPPMSHAICEQPSLLYGACAASATPFAFEAHQRCDTCLCPCTSSFCHNSACTLLTATPVQPTMLCAATTKILQSHYPERLGLAVCYSPPKLFSFTWRVSLCAFWPAVSLVAEVRQLLVCKQLLGHPVQSPMPLLGSASFRLLQQPLRAAAACCCLETHTGWLR